MRAGMFAQSMGNVQIIPLTDIEENGLTVNQYPRFSLNTENSGHTITFKGAVTLRSGVFYAYNCIFDEGCDVTQQGYVSFTGCTFREKSGEDFCLRVRYGSNAILQNTLFNVTTNARHRALIVYNNSYAQLNPAATFTGAFECLIRCPAYGSVYVTENCTPDTSDATGKRYTLDNHSLLALFKRGDAFLGEHLTPGTADESCSAY